MTIYYLTDGMAFIRSSVSISGNGLSSSISPPSEPDYVLMEVYNLLQQANLHTPRKAINNSISCNSDNFNTPSIFDESDTRVITWDYGNKTFLQKIGLIEGTGITIQDVSDTIPKLKIHVDSNIDSLWEVNKENPNFIVPKDDKGISANDKRIIDVGTPTFLTDATNKQYVDKKQDKLIAGENIKIDEKTNTISATGGSSVDENRIFNNKDDKDSTTRLVTEIIKTNVGGKTLIYRNNPVITDDLDIPNKKYVDDKINPNKENWKIIGKSLDNRTWEDFALSFNKYYRVFITWDKPPFHQTSVKIKIEFKSNEGAIGGNYTLVEGKIDGENASLVAKLGTVSGKSQLIIIGGNKEYANIFSLEELQDTFKVDIQSKLQIRSGSLTTNEVEENIWDIELKNNPTPNIPQWKEVGTKQDNKTINYNFVKNKRYRIYYNYCETETNKTYGWLIKEFLCDWIPSGDDLYLEYFRTRDDNNTWLLANFQKIYMVMAPYPFSFGKLFKLEELQE